MTSVQPQKEFEWIPHGDSSARKRARAHVTRGFRRAKAIEAQAKKGGPKSDSESPRSRSSSVEEENPLVILKGQAKPEPQDKVDTSASAKEVIDGLILQRTLGSGRADPFATYPVKLTSESQALLDHCKLDYMIGILLTDCWISFLWRGSCSFHKRSSCQFPACESTELQRWRLRPISFSYDTFCSCQRSSCASREARFRRWDQS